MGERHSVAALWALVDLTPVVVLGLEVDLADRAPWDLDVLPFTLRAATRLNMALRGADRPACLSHLTDGFHLRAGGVMAGAAHVTECFGYCV